MLPGAVAAFSDNKIQQESAYSSTGRVGYMPAVVCCGAIKGMQGSIHLLTFCVLMTLLVLSLSTDSAIP